MKGSFVRCLAELVKIHYDEHKWKEIMQMSVENPNMLIKAVSDIDDQTVFKIIENTCNVLNLSKQQVYDAFGDYWVNTYAPRMHDAYYIKFNDAKQFIMGMDRVHENVTRMIPNAHPPRFIIQETGRNILIVNYISTRHMIDLYIGLVKGVGRYFNTPIGIKKLSEDKVELTFG